MSRASRNERILLVGAGAVGQVYGYHLREGGAEVAFLVKEKYREQVNAGFVLHRHRLLRGTKTFGFADYEVLVDYDDVARRTWDQVWLCVSSPALRGEWLEELVGRIGSATLVSLQPGVDDFKRLENLYPAERIVCGEITLIAYYAPMEGEKLAEGVAYFLPPMLPTLFSGQSPRVESVVEALDRGGLPAKFDPETPSKASFATAVLVPTVAGLEVAGWSLDRFRKSPLFELSTAASREALRIVGLYHWKQPPLGMKLVRRPEILGTGLSAAPSLLPFDLETYVRLHFEKTADQTRQILDQYIALGQSQSHVTYALRILRQLLTDRPDSFESVEDVIRQVEPRAAASALS